VYVCNDNTVTRLFSMQHRDDSMVAETAAVVRSASQPRDMSSSSSSSAAAAAAMHRSVTFSDFDSLHRLTGDVTTR